MAQHSDGTICVSGFSATGRVGVFLLRRCERGVDRNTVLPPSMPALTCPNTRLLPSEGSMTVCYQRDGGVHCAKQEKSQTWPAAPVTAPDFSVEHFDAVSAAGVVATGLKVALQVRTR